MDCNEIPVDTKRLVYTVTVLRPPFERIFPLICDGIELVDFFSCARMIGNHILKSLSILPPEVPHSPTHELCFVENLFSKRAFERKSKPEV